MALRSLLRKMPALGLRSPAGPLMGPVRASLPARPLMGPVHASSPAAAAAASRHMSSLVSPEEYDDPDPRLNKLWETFDRQVAEHEKLHNEIKVDVEKNYVKCDKKVKTIIYAVNAFSAFLVLNAPILGIIYS